MIATLLTTFLKTVTGKGIWLLCAIVLLCSVAIGSQAWNSPVATESAFALVQLGALFQGIAGFTTLVLAVLAISYTRLQEYRIEFNAVSEMVSEYWNERRPQVKRQWFENSDWSKTLMDALQRLSVIFLICGLTTLFTVLFATGQARQAPESASVAQTPRATVSADQTPIAIGSIAQTPIASGETEALVATPPPVEKAIPNQKPYNYAFTNSVWMSLSMALAAANVGFGFLLLFVVVIDFLYYRQTADLSRIMLRACQTVFNGRFTLEEEKRAVKLIAKSQFAPLDMSDHLVAMCGLVVALERSYPLFVDCSNDLPLTFSGRVFCEAAVHSAGNRLSIRDSDLEDFIRMRLSIQDEDKLERYRVLFRELSTSRDEDSIERCLPFALSEYVLESRSPTLCSPQELWKLALQSFHAGSSSKDEHWYNDYPKWLAMLLHNSQIKDKAFCNATIGEEAFHALHNVQPVFEKMKDTFIGIGNESAILGIVQAMGTFMRGKGFQLEQGLSRFLPILFAIDLRFGRSIEETRTLWMWAIKGDDQTDPAEAQRRAQQSLPIVQSLLKNWDPDVRRSAARPLLELHKAFEAFGQKEKVNEVADEVRHVLSREPDVDVRAYLLHLLSMDNVWGSRIKGIREVELVEQGNGPRVICVKHAFPEVKYELMD